MKQWSVRVPVVGEVGVAVEAETAEEAEELAMDLAELVLRGESSEGEVVELSPVRRVVDGWVCYAPCTEIDVEES